MRELRMKKLIVVFSVFKAVLLLAVPVALAGPTDCGSWAAADGPDALEALFDVDGGRLLSR